MLAMERPCETQSFALKAEEPTQEKEQEETITHKTALDYDPSRIVAKGKVKSIKSNKNIKLLNLADSQTGGSCKIEFQTPMKLLYPYDPEKSKITLQLGSRNYKYREILDSLQRRGMQIASDNSPDGWSLSDLQNLYWNTPNSNELRLKIRKETKFFRITDPEEGTIEEADASVLERGALVYPVSKLPFIWYTGDACGLTQEGAGMAVLSPSDIHPFDFLLNADAKENLTNRCYSTVDFAKEADFSRKIHIAQNEIANISYYLNIDNFQMPRTRCPFGFDPRTNEETGQEADYATVEFELDENTTPFFQNIDNELTHNILDRYASWFGSIPDYVTKEFLLEKKVYKSCFVPSTSEYKGRYTVKAYKTGHPMATDYWVFDAKTNSFTRGTHNDLTRQCEAIPVITVAKLHFKGSGNRYSRIGSTVPLKRVLIYPKKDDSISGMLMFKKKKRTTPCDTEAPHTKRCKTDTNVAVSGELPVPEAEDDTDMVEEADYV